MLGLVAMASGSALAAPPGNDHYLSAEVINAPGTDLPRDAVSMPPVDPAEATLQGDLFSPPSAGGPPEPSECPGPPTTSFDRTVWYVFFPDKDGTVALSATGLDAIIGLVEFASPGDRSPQDYQCTNGSEGLTERMRARVSRDAGYAVQIGAVRHPGATTSGQVQLGLQFFPDGDGDGVADEDDECPRRRGSGADGCPPRIASSVAYSFTKVSGGVRLDDLRVSVSPLGARIRVRCSPGCGRASLRARRRVTVISSFIGRSLRRGSRLIVRVTLAGHFGTYQALRVKPVDVARGPQRCTTPGSRKPRSACR